MREDRCLQRFLDSGGKIHLSFQPKFLISSLPTVRLWPQGASPFPGQRIHGQTPSAVGANDGQIHETASVPLRALCSAGFTTLAPEVD